MTKNSNFPNREDKVPELLPDEREALIRALENGDLSVEPPPGVPTSCLELYTCLNDPVPQKWGLSDCGHLLAVELRKSDRLERAKGKLAEWESSTDDEWSSARLELSGSGPWLCELSVKGVDDSRAESDDPLTAVIEASKQTPWELEE